MTPPRTILLTERRAAVRRVPRADAADLAARFGHAVEVLPLAGRGRYRLTARGYIGWFHTPAVRWVLRPKLPWADLAALAGAEVPGGGGNPGELPAAFVGLVSGRLAALMLARADAGLVRGYDEREVVSPTVRGRILFAQLGRQPPLPGLGLPVAADEFTPDVAWNRIPLAAARRLLAAPGLPADARLALGRAADAFSGVGTTAPTPADFAAVADPTPRTDGYAPLLAWARLVSRHGRGAGGRPAAQPRTPLRALRLGRRRPSGRAGRDGGGPGGAPAPVQEKSARTPPAGPPCPPGGRHSGRRVGRQMEAARAGRPGPGRRPPSVGLRRRRGGRGLRADLPRPAARGAGRTGPLRGSGCGS